MGSFGNAIGRTFSLMGAKSREWIGKKEQNNAAARANEGAEELQKESSEFTTGAAEAVAQLGAMKDQKKAADEDAAKWSGLADTYKAAGNTANEEKAIGKMVAAQDLAAKLQAQIDAAQGRIDSLTQKAQDLDSQVTDAKNSAQAIGAREHVITAEEKIKSADPNAALNKIKQAEADVTLRERKQGAIDDMSGANLEADAARLQRKARIDAEMAKRHGAAPAAAPAAAPPAAAPGASPSNGHGEEWQIA